MIVIDEVHNIRSIGEGNKKISTQFKYLVHYVKKMKLLFLSGTPMYNDPKEIVFLINLFHQNDGSNSIIHVKDIFKKNGDLIKQGRNILINKLNGYVSYIRGENPYYFPYKIFPNDYNDSKSIKKIKYPTHQFNNKPIIDSIQHLDLYINKLSNFQTEAYKFFIEQKVSSLKESDIEKFENMDSFGYNLLQELLYALNICYIDPENNKFVTGKSGLETIVNSTREKKLYIY